MSDTSLTSRAIRSFVIRNGRMTDGQQKALDTLLPVYGITYRSEPLNFEQVFGNNHPVWLEIGFGDGESLLTMAANQPNINFLGIEVHAPGVGHLLHELDKRGVENLRVIRHDAMEVLAKMIPASSLERVLIFFPDPWPKKKHHKRRIVQTETLLHIEATLQPGGVLHCATDWAEYAEVMLELLSGREKLVSQPGDALLESGFHSKPSYRPQTKFEARGIRLGHEVFDLLFERV